MTFWGSQCTPLKARQDILVRHWQGGPSAPSRDCVLAAFWEYVCTATAACHAEGVPLDEQCQLDILLSLIYPQRDGGLAGTGDEVVDPRLRDIFWRVVAHDDLPSPRLCPLKAAAVYDGLRRRVFDDAEVYTRAIMRAAWSRRRNEVLRLRVQEVEAVGLSGDAYVPM
jgi:hypothetical protein